MSDSENIFQHLISTKTSTYSVFYYHMKKVLSNVLAVVTHSSDVWVQLKNYIHIRLGVKSKVYINNVTISRPACI